MHIAIEGMDGVGKTTAATILARRLGFTIVEKPLHYLIDEEDELVNYIRTRDYINQQTENDALRAWFYGLGNLFLAHRFADQNVITDRHLVSNYFWCGGEETEPIFQCLIDLIGKPDFTFLLWTSPEEGKRRLRARDEHDPDLVKADLYPDSREKMESFLQRYQMDYLAIDTTALDADKVVDKIIGSLPADLKAKLDRAESR